MHIPNVAMTFRAILRWGRALLEILATVLVVVVSIAVLGKMGATSAVRPRAEMYAGTRRPTALPIPKQPITIKGAALLGRPDAPVVLLIFSDFQCPFCARFARESLPTLVAKYVNTGRLLLAFRSFPLESIHPFSLRAAEAAECASRAGKFWAMHDLLFANQAALSEPDLQSWAASIGIDPVVFKTCVNEDSVGAAIRASEDAGRAVEVDGTPTFFIGSSGSGQTIAVRKRLSGALPAQAFTNDIDAILLGHGQP